MQHRVRVLDGAWCESLVTQLVDRVLHSERRDLVQPQVPEVGEDVQPHLEPIAVQCALRNSRLRLVPLLHIPRERLLGWTDERLGVCLPKHAREFSQRLGRSAFDSLAYVPLAAVAVASEEDPQEPLAVPSRNQLSATAWAALVSRLLRTCG